MTLTAARRLLNRTRGRTFGAAATLVLLREKESEGVAPALEVVRRVSNDWAAGSTLTSVKVADVSEAFAADMRKSTHLVVINSKLTAANGALHELTSDTDPPAGARPWWAISAASASRKYVPPEA